MRTAGDVMDLYKLALRAQLALIYVCIAVNCVGLVQGERPDSAIVGFGLAFLMVCFIPSEPDAA